MTDKALEAALPEEAEVVAWLRMAGDVVEEALLDADAKDEMHDPIMSYGLAYEPLVRASALEASQAQNRELAREALAADGQAMEAQARIAELTAALEFYAKPENYKGEFVPGGRTDHGTFAMAHHVNAVRKDAGEIARKALQHNGEGDTNG